MVSLDKEYGYINSFLTENEEIIYKAPKQKSMLIFGWFLIIATLPCFVLLPASLFTDMSIFNKIFCLLILPIIGMSNYWMIRDSISSKLYLTNKGLLLKRFSNTIFISYDEIKKIGDISYRYPLGLIIRLKSKKYYRVCFLDPNKIKEKIKEIHPEYTEPEISKRSKKQTIIIVSVLFVVYVILTIFQGYLIINKDKNLKNTTQTKKETEVLSKNPSEFIPYMETVQTKIRKNWHPPKDNNSKSIQALFSLNRNGELIKSSISKSSGNLEMDKSILNAIKKSSPFKPLPKTYKEPTIDIQFTFDYNVK